MLDPASSPIKDHPEYASLVAAHFPLEEPFIQRVIDAEGPISFFMEEVIHAPGSPSFLRVNYERGTREILMTPLRIKDQTIGFIHIYADNTKSFTREFRNIIKGIMPQLSSAVANIIKNDEIRRKEWINEALLGFNTELVKVRNRKDLLKVINHDLKEIIPFSYGMMTVLDETGNNYQPYVIDEYFDESDFAKPIQQSSSFDPVQDGVYDMASLYYKPVVFDMETFDEEKMPAWFRFYVSKGAKEMVMKILPAPAASTHSLILFADKKGTFNEEALTVIQHISTQLSTATSNTAANEEILDREREKSFLLDFSSDIAAARSKDDLSEAVRKALKKLANLRGYVIRKIDADGQTMSSYIHDETIVAADDPDLLEILNSRFPINDGLQNRVLDSPVPLLLSVNGEISRGITSRYLLFWKKVGFKTMVGTSLKSGDTKLGILWLGIEDVNLPLLKGICDQISIAMSNIMANEEVLNKEREQKFLLDFSQDIAGVRTKDDLELAVTHVLKEVLNIRLSMLRIVEDDGITLSPYMYDKKIFFNQDPMFLELASKNIDIYEEVSARVFNSEGPVIFNIQHEEENGNNSGYLQFWKKVGFENAFGAPLRVGNTNIGTLWLLTNQINMTILKGICAQVSVAIANIRANEKILTYKQRLEIENDYLQEQIKTIYNFSDIIGSGEAMQKVYRLMTHVAQSSSTVLLLGETGTGKELIARALHNSSPRKNK
ncbi:MAG: hypothetical protein EOO02_09545, partial [Chitinophagaceae bacterium]